MVVVKNQVIYRKLSELKKFDKNPRTITKKDLEVLKTSIKNNPEFLEARPLILSDRTGDLVIIAGNQRYEATKALKMAEIPTVLLSNLTEEKEREIIIRDNISNGEWGMDRLANEWDINKLQEWGLKEIRPFKEILEDVAPKIDDKEVFSEIGKIYSLGSHKVYCGSFEDNNAVTKMFGNKKATCTFTDPSYNIAYKSADGKSIKNDSMKAEDFQVFLGKACECIKSFTVRGGGVIAWMSDAELLTLKNAFDNAGLNFKTILCWVKSQFTFGRGDFQSAKEPAIYGINEGSYDGSSEDTDEFQYGIYGRDGGKFTDSRKLSNVWFFDKPLSSKDHPTMKPIGLCAKGILVLSDPQDIVFDPFLGSGSTLIACQQTGRICFGCELDPKYCDVIRKRYWTFITGIEDGWQEGTVGEEV